MKSIPTTWTGNWIDDLGRIITIKAITDTDYKVSIKDKNAVPFKIDLAGFARTDRETIGLKSRFTNDTDGRKHLQVEAGMDEIGPTYQLYFVVEEKEKLRLATISDHIDNIRIKPNIGIGLYDDWDDDLGVPWALPLIDYRKAG